MPDIIVLPIMLMGMLDPTTQQGWGTSFYTYDTVEECRLDLPTKLAWYKTDWPDAVMWCAAPVEEMLVMPTSPRPKANPRRS